MEYDVIVVGAGFAGATIAERFANKLNKKVLIIDKRKHIAGNMYDYMDENGILVHLYGPHLFHTSNKKVYDYLSNFTEWFKYEHRVLGKVTDKLVPIPFNITSIEKCFDIKKAAELKEKLISKFGIDKKVPILELKKECDEEINNLAQFIYENVFLYYTMKQWGQTPEEIDPNTTNRVPVYVSLDDRYFQDQYQYMPKQGYTKLFENMLNSPNIEIKLGTEAKDIFKIENSKIIINNVEYKGKVIYTGALDELLDYKYGALPYRSLDFKFETINKEYFQPVGTVNYPTKEEKFTRITEYKHMTLENCKSNRTTLVYEYPCNCENGKIPYYPIINDENLEKYQKYLSIVKNIDNFYLIGRLAQYKYYNMDAVIAEALEKFEEMEVEK